MTSPDPDNHEKLGGAEVDKNKRAGDKDQGRGGAAIFGSEKGAPASTKPTSNKTGTYRQFPKLTLAAQWLTVIFAALAFGAAAYYASQAKQQVREAIKANGLAHENAVNDLRAYVDPSRSDGRIPVELVWDKKTKQLVDIKIYFRNGGKTPAHHFAARSLLDIPRGQRRFRNRYIEEGTTGPMKGVALGTTGGLSLNDTILTSGEQYSVSFPTDAKIINEFLVNVRQRKARSGEFKLLAGYFEYCDVFGIYRCDAFSYQFRPDTVDFIETEMGKIDGCKPFLPPETDPPFGIPATKNVKWIPLPRCESPKELAVDQGGKLPEADK